MDGAVVLRDVPGGDYDATHARGQMLAASQGKLLEHRSTSQQADRAGQQHRDAGKQMQRCLG
jgi:hypothetical protein